jgi:hypothetical protein
VCGGGFQETEFLNYLFSREFSELVVSIVFKSTEMFTDFRLLQRFSGYRDCVCLMVPCVNELYYQRSE